MIKISFSVPSFVFSWVVFPITHTCVIGSKATFIDKWKTSLGVTSHQGGQVIEGRNVIRWFPRHNFGLTTFEPEKFDSRTRFFLPPYWIACINHTYVPATRVSCVRGFTFFFSFTVTCEIERKCLEELLEATVLKVGSAWHWVVLCYVNFMRTPPDTGVTPVS